MSSQKRITATNCKNCGAHLHGRFCSACGQKVYTDKDDSIRSMVMEAAHFITHFEGKFLTTLKAVFLRPGKMSTDHANGIRQPYYKPISLFLLLVVLYLLFPIFQGLNMKMGSYKTTMLGDRLTEQMERKAEADGIGMDELGDRFDERSKTTSKVLLVLLIPMTAPLLRALHPKKRRKWYHDLVLATEINAFYLLAFYLLAPVLIGGFGALTGLFPEEEVLGLTLLVVFAGYAAIVFGTVYGQPRWLTVLKAVLFAVLHTAILNYVYKPLLFETTLALI